MAKACQQTAWKIEAAWHLSFCLSENNNLPIHHIGSIVPVMSYYAHTGRSPDKSDWQKLHPHLIGVAERAAAYADAVGLERAAFVAGLLHDLGKYDPDFQKKLEGARKMVDHSTAGAKVIIERAGPDNHIIASLIAHVILGLYYFDADHPRSEDLSGAGENPYVAEALAMGQERACRGGSTPVSGTQTEVKPQIPQSLGHRNAHLNGALACAAQGFRRLLVKNPKTQGRFSADAARSVIIRNGASVSRRCAVRSTSVCRLSPPGENSSVRQRLLCWKILF